MYESVEQIERIVRGFESCETAKTDFHHREHLTVAVFYLQTLSPAEAVERMRAALLRFIQHHGIDPRKYSEEITVFWIETVAAQLAEIGDDVSLVDRCNRVIERFGQQPEIRQ